MFPDNFITAYSSGPVVIMTAAVAVVIVVMSIFLAKVGTNKRKKALPVGGASMWANVAAYDSKIGVKPLENLEHYRRQGLEVIQKGLSCKHGPVFTVSLPKIVPTILVMDYICARMVLTGNLEGEKADMMKISNYLGDEVYHAVSKKTSDEQRDSARKAVLHSFSMNSLRMNVPGLYGLIAKAFRHFDNRQQGQIVDISVFLKNFILRSFFKLSFGGVKVMFDVPKGDEAEEEEILLAGDDNVLNGTILGDMLTRMGEEKTRCVLNPFRNFVFWDPDVQRAKADSLALQGMMKKVLTLYKATHSEEQIRSDPSVIGRLVTHGYPSEIELLADLMVFIIAGHETSANAVAFLFWELTRHPEKMKRLRSELDYIMPATFSVDIARDTSLISKIMNLPYLNCCIKESQRLWPAFGGGLLRDLLHDIEYGGYTLPKGSTCVVHLYSLFRQPWIDRYDDFVPERWMEGNPQLGQLKEMFIPFSVGKRSCTGQNMAMMQARLIAANFLHYFDFSMVEEACPSFAMFLVLPSLRMRVTKRDCSRTGKEHNT